MLLVCKSSGKDNAVGYLYMSLTHTSLESTVHHDNIVFRYSASRQKRSKLAFNEPSYSLIDHKKH